MMAFTSPEDMMKNLPKAMANVSKAMGGAVDASGKSRQAYTLCFKLWW